MEQLSIPIVLASGSPRRRELLRLCGVPYSLVHPEVDEACDITAPELLVKELAARKARAGSKLARGRAAVIGADTVVCCEGGILGKPRDEKDAARMLRLLSGKSHYVYTGVCVTIAGEAELVDSCRTRVDVDTLTGAAIADYIATGEPMDKAGAYAVQGLFARYIKSIEGCYYNVMGLPLNLLCKLLSSLGINI